MFYLADSLHTSRNYLSLLMNGRTLAGTMLEKKVNMFLPAMATRSPAPKNRYIFNEAHLEGLDKGPKKSLDPRPLVEKLHETQGAKQTKESKSKHLLTLRK